MDGVSSDQGEDTRSTTSSVEVQRQVEIMDRPPIDQPCGSRDYRPILPRPGPSSVPLVHPNRTPAQPAEYARALSLLVGFLKNHVKKGNKQTHFLAAYNSKYHLRNGALDIPSDAVVEFWEKYVDFVNAYGMNYIDMTQKNHEPNSITERIDPNGFKFFIDLDFKYETFKAWQPKEFRKLVYTILSNIKPIIKNNCREITDSDHADEDLIEIMSSRNIVGWHINYPNLVTSKVTAIALRDVIVKKLTSILFDNDFGVIDLDNIIDKSVYNNSGLRMYGSHKGIMGATAKGKTTDETAKQKELEMTQTIYRFGGNVPFGYVYRRAELVPMENEDDYEYKRYDEPLTVGAIQLTSLRLDHIVVNGSLTNLPMKETIFGTDPALEIHLIPITMVGKTIFSDGRRVRRRPRNEDDENSDDDTGTHYGDYLQAATKGVATVPGIDFVDCPPLILQVVQTILRNTTSVRFDVKDYKKYVNDVHLFTLAPQVCPFYKRMHTRGENGRGSLYVLISPTDRAGKASDDFTGNFYMSCFADRCVHHNVFIQDIVWRHVVPGKIRVETADIQSSQADPVPPTANSYIDRGLDSELDISPEVVERVDSAENTLQCLIREACLEQQEYIYKLIHEHMVDPRLVAEMMPEGPDVEQLSFLELLMILPMIVAKSPPPSRLNEASPMVTITKNLIERARISAVEIRGVLGELKDVSLGDAIFSMPAIQDFHCPDELASQYSTGGIRGFVFTPIEHRWIARTDSVRNFILHGAFFGSVINLKKGSNMSYIQLIFYAAYLGEVLSLSFKSSKQPPHDTTDDADADADAGNDGDDTRARKKGRGNDGRKIKKVESELVKTLKRLDKTYKEIQSILGSQLKVNGLIAQVSNNCRRHWAVMTEKIYEERRSSHELAVHNNSSRDVDKFRHLLNTNPSLLGCANCVLEFRENVDPVTKKRLGSFKVKARAGRPEDYVSSSTHHVYLKYEKYPIELREAMESFINQILPIEHQRKYIMHRFASCLKGVLSEQVFTLLQGKGSNGKSSLIRFLRRATGDYFKTCSVSLFTEKRGDPSRPSPDLLRLIGSRIVVCQEPNRDDTLLLGTLKSVTGGDIMTGRQLFV
ncbi:uncharacterized protein BJ171DRAFT_598560 [Polychytrium aggregatum]|uniref:uncharacterized protein n=1 Tax=Polychytrium aggregatum TaxID=110093 RepID=UPI0022FF4503|nr:uncharacterized protein BJ171DRAFT_598560 [Polychytrium aggregatum]KAI9205467.1 hypothetical protein BJ171DRAFT_598560 [Polychytrium aggregatum]